jgi:Transposase domain (DUF772)
MGKSERQMNFVDEMANRGSRGNRTARFLGKLEAVVDFTPIEAALREAYTATRGRDPPVMFKMTLLQHFYDLSDPECEAQVADRRSFREFCGPGLADRVPDESSGARWPKGGAFARRAAPGGRWKTALVRFHARLLSA